MRKVGILRLCTMSTNISMSRDFGGRFIGCIRAFEGCLTYLSEPRRKDRRGTMYLEEILLLNDSSLGDNQESGLSLFSALRCRNHEV